MGDLNGISALMQKRPESWPSSLPCEEHGRSIAVHKLGRRP